MKNTSAILASRYGGLKESGLLVCMEIFITLNVQNAEEIITGIILIFALVADKNLINQRKLIMPYNVPSAQELVNRNVANIEAQLNQKTPPAERAFNTVLSTITGMAQKELYSYATDLARENLALTASEEGLERLGEEYGVYRVQPTVWEGLAVFAIPDGQTLLLGTAFIGQNGLVYKTTASVTAPSFAPGSGVLVPIACTEGGPVGNLSVNDILAIQTPIGAGRTAIVTETVKLGNQIEDLEVFRQRLLDFERSEGGGGNSSDLRSWAQAVAGVRRAYPFSGPPEGTDRDPLPGERTVYVECYPDINADGIPPQSLLDLVRAALLADPVTGVSREILGLTGDTLYVRPIKRTGLYVTVQGMRITSGNIGNAQDDIRQAVASLFETFSPFVQGLDPDFDRRDSVTQPIISREVQNVLEAYGGSAQGVLFGTQAGSFLGKYDLRRNEKVKPVQVDFQGAE